MKKVVCIVLLFNFIFGYDEIILTEQQMQKMGISNMKPDFI